MATQRRWFQEVSQHAVVVTPKTRRSPRQKHGIKEALQENKSVWNILENFLDTTQINWIYYGSTRRGIWRIIWIMVMLSGIGMALLQSKSAMKGYAGYDVSLQTTYLLNSTLPFPAITICSNSPINWLYEEMQNSTIFQEVTLRLRDRTESNKYNTKFKRKGKAYEEYVLFDVLRKYPLPLPTYGVVKSVDWNGTKYSINGSAGKSFEDLKKRNIIKLTTNFYYGDCLTFNAGVDHEEKIDSPALTGIQFILDWDPKDRYPEINDPSVIFVLHPSEAAPIFGDGNIFKIYAKDEVTVGVKERLIERLPSPYPSQCVDSDDYPLRSNSVYYSDDRRYLYSIDACINTCLQRLSLQICSCWDYTIPLGMLQNSSEFNSTYICASRCSKIDSALNLKLCKCNLPCREITLQTSFSVQSTLVTEFINNEFGNPDTINFTEAIMTAPTPVSESKTTLSIFLKTTMYEYSREVPKYTLADFWGIVGGNAAFWIGISAVSCFEVVELLAHLTQHGFIHAIKKMSTSVRLTPAVQVLPKLRYRHIRRIKVPIISRILNRTSPQQQRDTHRFIYIYDPVLPRYAQSHLDAISLNPYYGQEIYNTYQNYDSSKPI